MSASSPSAAGADIPPVVEPSTSTRARILPCAAALPAAARPWPSVVAERGEVAAVGDQAENADAAGGCANQVAVGFDHGVTSLSIHPRSSASSSPSAPLTLS